DVGALVGLVRRLVLREPHVGVGPEQLRGAEGRLQRGGQRRHRRLHRLVVHVLVRLPERLGVVELEVVVEVEGRDREAGELAHALSWGVQRYGVVPPTTVRPRRSRTGRLSSLASTWSVVKP